MKAIDLPRYVSEFLEKTSDIDYEQAGAFKSELFLIYCLHREFNNDMFVESGICNGHSTRTLLSLIKEPYYGIDSQDPKKPALELAIPNSNFSFILGDSNNEIEKILQKYPNKNISVFIDGPKGAEAVSLKNRILENYNNVPFVAVHDTYDGVSKYAERHSCFESMSNAKYNLKYFNLFNKSNNGKVDIFNLLNTGSATTYAQDYPNGPGLAIYAKNPEINFKL